MSLAFKACLNKEFKQTLRTKKFYITLSTAIALAGLAVAYVIIMTLLKDFFPQENLGEIAIFFQNSYAASLNFFMSFMSTYFLVIVVLLNAGNISTQINNKQWILPLNAGIKTRHLISSNLIMVLLSTLFSVLVASVLHFVLTIAFCLPGQISIASMFVSYGAFMVFSAFAVVLTITLNAISKKRWVPSVVVFALIILCPLVFDAIKIAGNTLTSYTPFAFFALSMQTMQGQITYNFWQWFFAISTTAVICGGLIVWAITRSKVKAQKSQLSFKNMFAKKS